MSNRLVYSIYGFLLGLGFPAVAFSLDVIFRRLPFTLKTFVSLHQGGPIYWIIDTAPFVLLIVFGLIGTREDQLADLAANLQNRVSEATSTITSERKFFETLVDGNPLATVILDAEGRILRINAAFEGIFQYAAAEVLGQSLDPLITDDDSLRTASNLTKRVLAGEVVRSSFVRLRKDGRAIHVNLHAVPVVVGEDHVGALAIYEDVSERIHIQNQLINLLEETDKLASTDSLTGLYNRRAITGLLEAEISTAMRESLPVCLMLIDIDTFKEINDQHGHQAGDLAIRLVAEKIQADKRDRDVLGRWGGDEFIVILPNTTPQDGEKVGRRFCGLVRKAKLSLGDGRELQLNLSAGVCGWEPGSGQPLSSERLFHQADRALMAAKEQGKNRTVSRGID